MPILKLFKSDTDAQTAVSNLREEGFRDVTVVRGAGAADAIGKHGVSTERAAQLAARVAQGETLVVVRADFGRGAAATEILDSVGPYDYEEETLFHHDAPVRDNAAPFSNALGLKLLINNPAPLSSLLGLRTLSRKQSPGPTSHGLPTLSANAAPLSSALGLPTLTRQSGPFKGTFGIQLLSGRAAPLSRALGLKTLTDNAAPLSKAVGMKPLSHEAAPLSKLLGLPVLSGDKTHLS